MPPITQGLEIMQSILPSASLIGATTSVDEIVLQSSQDNTVAHAGGGQALGTPITANVVNVTTVATIGDSLTLPPAIGGVDIVVHNSAANSMNVFPSTGQFINALAINTAIAMPANTSTTFTCLTSGKWITVPRVPS